MIDRKQLMVSLIYYYYYQGFYEVSLEEIMDPRIFPPSYHQTYFPDCVPTSCIGFEMLNNSRDLLTSQ